jgi:hypothetical protein
MAARALTSRPGSNRAGPECGSSPPSRISPGGHHEQTGHQVSPRAIHGRQPAGAQRAQHAGGRPDRHRQPAGERAVAEAALQQGRHERQGGDHARAGGRRTGGGRGEHGGEPVRGTPAGGEFQAGGQDRPERGSGADRGAPDPGRAAASRAGRHRVEDPCLSGGPGAERADGAGQRGEGGDEHAHGQGATESREGERPVSPGVGSGRQLQRGHARYGASRGLQRDCTPLRSGAGAAPAGHWVSGAIRLQPGRASAGLSCRAVAEQGDG